MTKRAAALLILLWTVFLGLVTTSFLSLWQGHTVAALLEGAGAYLIYCCILETLAWIRR